MCISLRTSVDQYGAYSTPADHSGRAVLPRSNAWIVGSNPTPGMDVCVCDYSVLVLSCVLVAALRWADLSSKSPTVCVEKDYETEKVMAQQRAAEPLMNE
jgi:hypothetical protein